ncbi:MAG TPA: YHS domain-containing protein, partial [Polyangiaceae bacterium]|nr:YHS domain-containing protein [Polyangiaceae bacterium]
ELLSPRVAPVHDETTMKEVSRGFVFADLSGYTALTEAHGDLDAATVAGRFAEGAQQALLPGSQLVKTVGDELMIATDTVETAVDVALSLFRAVDDEPDFPTFSAGLHYGTCVEQGSDYFGATVNLAARVAGHARSGQILCTQVIADRARSRPGVDLRCLGSCEFRHVAEAVEVWELALVDRPIPSGILDPVCRMRVDPGRALGRLTHNGVEFYFCSLKCAGAFAAKPEHYASSNS